MNEVHYLKFLSRSVKNHWTPKSGRRGCVGWSLRLEMSAQKDMDAVRRQMSCFRLVLEPACSAHILYSVPHDSSPHICFSPQSSPSRINIQFLGNTTASIAKGKRVRKIIPGILRKEVSKLIQMWRYEEHDCVGVTLRLLHHSEGVKLSQWQ